jgi:hypothetical protein
MIVQETLTLNREGDSAGAGHVWTAGANGLYRVRVELDPDRRIAESREDNNVADLVLPVLAKERKFHFVWYRESPQSRWTTCVTSVKSDQGARLTERGVTPLKWDYGGMSWRNYDKEKAEANPEEVVAEVEERFYGKYTRELENLAGFGIDECGGYPGTLKEKLSIASMKALIRAKREMPNRFFAVWHAGGLRTGLAQYYRQGADLLLLETYVFRAVPQELGIERVYQVIRGRLEPLARSADMLTPAYGNWCHTLIALDTSERPDWIDLGEQEQVVRFIRRICPEMQGIAWYNGGYGKYGLTRTEETDRQHEAVLANADRLCFEYFIKPCITFQSDSLWLDADDERGWVLAAAVSNIGGMDSGPVTVEFRVDGKAVGEKRVDKVPAGVNRLVNRVVLRQPVSVTKGGHDFEARIVTAPDATLLDATITENRFIP